MVGLRTVDLYDIIPNMDELKKSIAILVHVMIRY